MHTLLRTWGFPIVYSHGDPFSLKVQLCLIGLVNNIPTMHLVTGIYKNTQSKSDTLSLTASVWEFRNNALWDTYEHALFVKLVRRFSLQAIPNLFFEMSGLSCFIEVAKT